jgi:hypothetical protein
MLSGEAAYYVKFHSAWFDPTGDSRSRSTTLVVSTLTIEPQSVGLVQNGYNYHLPEILLVLAMISLANQIAYLAFNNNHSLNIIQKLRVYQHIFFVILNLFVLVF